jgi:molecular chaperone DnaJ
LDALRCYGVLGLQKGASFKEVKQAYRKLSLRYHPDRNKNTSTEQKFEEITEAYQTLRLEQKKENSRHKDADTAHTEFWKYYEKKDATGFEYQTRYEAFRRNFGANDTKFESHNVEKPISHRMTHLLLYGGLGAIALWIILNEIFK